MGPRTLRTLNLYFQGLEHISARALRTKAEYNHAPISIQLLRAMLHCALGVLYAGLDHHLQESGTIIKYCSEISLHASETFLKQDYSDHVQWPCTLLIYRHLIKPT